MHNTTSHPLLLAMGKEMPGSAQHNATGLTYRINKRDTRIFTYLHMDISTAHVIGNDIMSGRHAQGVEQGVEDRRSDVLGWNQRYSYLHIEENLADRRLHRSRLHTCPMSRSSVLTHL